MKIEEAASRACRRLTIAPLLALALLGRPPLAHATGAITSITPACAATGSDVVITGRGFGAPNVTITVGGVPAQVFNATGYRVTFVVPAGMPSGVTDSVAVVVRPVPDDPRQTAGVHRPRRFPVPGRE